MRSIEKQIADLFGSDYIEDTQGGIVVKTNLWIHTILGRLHSEGYIVDGVTSYKWVAEYDTESDAPPILYVNIVGLKTLKFILL